MTKARSWSRRSFADSAMGSISHGSEGPMTRARRRRLLAESSDRSGTNSEPSVQDLAATGHPRDWRDWANLTCDLVEDIAGRLLSHDVSEYYRLRAVCRPWRDHTADLRARGGGALLDRRFRPAPQLVVLAISPDAGPRRRVLNMSTAACLSVTLPALTTHCHVGAVDGLLILLNRIRWTISLLDPLSNAVTEFPAISSVVVDAPPMMALHFNTFLKNPNGHSVNGACLDESTSPPTLVLLMRDNQHSIVVAKPGDPHWTLATPGKLRYPETLGRVMFHSFLSHGGRCYVSTREGSIFLLELGSQPPQLVEIISQCQHATMEVISYKPPQLAWKVIKKNQSHPLNRGRNDHTFNIMEMVYSSHDVTQFVNWMCWIQ